MLSLLLNRQPLVRRGIIGLALILSAGAGAGLLLWGGPLAPLLLGGGACATALGLFLLRRPLIALYVALIMRLFPWGDPPTEIPFAFTVLESGAVVVALCAWMLHASSQRRPILWNGVCSLIFLYIVWASVTLLWAPDIIAGLEKLRRYSTGLLFLFLVVNLVTSVRAIDGMMRVLATIGWTIVILGLHAMFFTDYQFGNRLDVVNINENELGLTLILMLPGAVWPVLRSSGPRRYLHVALSVVFVLCTLILVLASGSRGSTVSLVIMLLAFWFWKPLRPLGIAGGLLVAGILASAPFLLDTLNNRFEEEQLGGPLGGRAVLWEASLQLIQDYPWTGVGVGNGRVALHRYISSLTSAYAEHSDLPSHNPLLEAGVDTGLFGMFVYASICVSALWQFFHQRGPWYMREGALAAYFPLVLCGAAGYLASWIKSGGMENHPTFFVLLALLIIPSQLSSGSDSAIDHVADAPARRRLRKAEGFH